MKTILTFAIFAALLAIPQFTNNAAFAHPGHGRGGLSDNKAQACEDARSQAHHSHSDGSEHQYDQCRCLELTERTGEVLGWTCETIYQ